MTHLLFRRWATHLLFQRWATHLLFRRWAIALSILRYLAMCNVESIDWSTVELVENSELVQLSREWKLKKYLAKLDWIWRYVVQCVPILCKELSEPNRPSNLSSFSSSFSSSYLRYFFLFFFLANGKYSLKIAYFFWIRV